MNSPKSPGNQFWNIFVRQRDFALIKLIGVLIVSGIILWAYSSVREQHPNWPEAKLPEQLGLVAILFAALQYTDAKEQNNELRQLLRATSTRSVGVFPDNITDILEVINGAKRHLYILTDFVAYGQYSAPRQFEKYFAALRKLPKRVNLQIICYDAQVSKKAALEHLPDGDEYLKEKQTEQFLKSSAISTTSYQFRLAMLLCATFSTFVSKTTATDSILAICGICRRFTFGCRMTKPLSLSKLRVTKRLDFLFGHATEIWLSNLSESSMTQRSIRPPATRTR